jgi:histone demethylase JARID1
VDVEKLVFTPRVQRINELEAATRIKLNFLDQIAKFWELQGSSLKIPMVERKALDLYSLHRIVQDEGGLEIVTKDRKWSKIASQMGYPAGKSVGTILKSHYERILYPYDIYTTGKIVDISKLESEQDDRDYKPHCIVSRQQVTPPPITTARRSQRFAAQKEHDQAQEQRNKFSDFLHKHIKEEECEEKKVFGPDPMAKYICHICERGDVEESMLLCDGCDDSYHTFCLMPPLSDIPKGDWRCPKCVVEEVNKPAEAFGFEQAAREYSLQQFGEMADQFKSKYFNMPVHLVPTDLVEKEFWRIVSSVSGNFCLVL